MKPFQIAPAIAEYADFGQFAEAEGLNEKDLILTNEYIYKPSIAPYNVSCIPLFQEKYGAGEPSDVMIDEIIASLKEKEYNRIVAVGGGTIIDIAKILAVASEGDDTDSLFDKKDSLAKIHPLFIVPTTCGTGSEVTNLSIINRTRRGTKMGLGSPAMYADQAVLISGMLTSLPYSVFATSSTDAMIHAVESFLSPNACAMSELFSREALKLILGGWQYAASNGPDSWKDKAADFLRASDYAGIAFGNAGCAAVHALSYPLGASHHIPHGQSNQLMFADVMRKYQEKKPVGKLNRLEDILADIFGTESASALSALYTLMEKILPKSPLREHGVTEDELPEFTRKVLDTQQRLLNNNYVELSYDDILSIYKESF